MKRVIATQSQHKWVKRNEAFIQKHAKTKPQIATLVAGHPMLEHLQGRVEKQSGEIKDLSGVQCNSVCKEQRTIFF